MNKTFFVLLALIVMATCHKGVKVAHKVTHSLDVEREAESVLLKKRLNCGHESMLLAKPCFCGTVKAYDSYYFFSLIKLVARIKFHAQVKLQKHAA